MEENNNEVVDESKPATEVSMSNTAVCAGMSNLTIGCVVTEVAGVTNIVMGKA